MTVRLLQTMAGAEVGGAEAFFVRLAAAFAKTGLDQRIVIRRNAARARALREGGIEPLELPFGGRMDFRTRSALRREIDRYRPDVVLSWMSRASWATPKAREPGRYRLVARLGGYYDLKYYRHCDYLIGLTEDIVDYVAGQGFERGKIVHLTNFVRPPSRPAISRLGFDTPFDAPLLLGLGRLHENKAFDVLLRAMPGLPGVWLWIAGEGPEAPALTRLAAELGVEDRVRFLGWREDADALMQACDIFVHPSRHEPFGSIVPEAWVANKPIVATAATGPAHLIGDDEAGVLVPVDDPEALAAGILSLLRDAGRADALAAEGRRRYERDHTERAVVAKYLRFFEEIA